MVSRDTNRFDKGGIIRAVAILLALICFGCLIWQIVGVRDDPVGTTIGGYEGMTRDEIQEALNRTVEENMMTVSIASTATINEDGSVRVNLVNPEDNAFYQQYSIIQDEEVLYTSEPLAPGRKIETCEIDGLEPGEASIEIQAVTEDTNEAHGSPTRVNITVNEAQAS